MVRGRESPPSKTLSPFFKILFGGLREIGSGLREIKVALSEACGVPYMVIEGKSGI